MQKTVLSCIHDPKRYMKNKASIKTRRKVKLKSTEVSRAVSEALRTQRRHPEEG